MQTNNIDQLFKEKLHDVEGDIPMDMLDRIRKKRKHKPWWMLLGSAKGLIVMASVAAVVLAIWVLWPESATKEQQHHAAVSTQQVTEELGYTIAAQLPIVSEEKKNAKKQLVLENIKIQSTSKYKNQVADKPQEINENTFVQMAEGVSVAEEESIAEKVPVSVEAKTHHSESIDMLSLKKAELVFDTELILPDLMPTKEKTKCAAFNAASKGLYIEANVSMDLALRKLTAVNSLDEWYVTERKHTEFPLTAYSFGARVSYQTGSGVALKSGIDYHDISEKFEILAGSEDKTIIKIIRDPEDNIIGTDTIQVTYDNYEYNKNSYQLIDLPILVGYELNFADFSLSSYLGPVINLRMTSKGRIISPDDVTAIDISSHDDIFKKEVGVAFYGNLGFGYKFNQKTQLRFEPYLKYYPKSFTQDINPSRQNYLLTGLRVGVKRKIR